MKSVEATNVTLVDMEDDAKNKRTRITNKFTMVVGDEGRDDKQCIQFTCRRRKKVETSDVSKNLRER